MGNKLMQNDSVPLLDEWMTLPDAARELGISRQYAYKLAADDYFGSIHRVGESVLVVSADEVAEKVAIRTKKKED